MDALNYRVNDVLPKGKHLCLAPSVIKNDAIKSSSPMCFYTIKIDDTNVTRVWSYVASMVSKAVSYVQTQANLYNVHPTLTLSVADMNPVTRHASANLTCLITIALAEAVQKSQAARKT